jgi:hypothetical protein
MEISMKPITSLVSSSPMIKIWEIMFNLLKANHFNNIAHLVACFKYWTRSKFLTEQFDKSIYWVAMVGGKITSQRKTLARPHILPQMFCFGMSTSSKCSHLVSVSPTVIDVILACKLFWQIMSWYKQMQLHLLTAK